MINSQFSGFSGIVALLISDGSNSNKNKDNRDNIDPLDSDSIGNIIDGIHFFEIGVNDIDLFLLEMSAMHTNETALVHLKQSEDQEIHFVPFCKRKDSWCSSQGYYFETDYVNVHNVHSMLFGNNELSFTLAGSYPHLIKVPKDNEIILNDRTFEVVDYFNNELNKEDDGLREVELRDNYQTAENFCAFSTQIERIQIDNSGRHIMNKLIVNGGCYDVLYLPASSIFFQQKSFQLLASEWGGTAIDSNTYAPQMIIAAENFASINIILRSSLTELNLILVITRPL